jgi:hypothetical protein
MTETDKRMDSKARRAARRVGLIASKTRWRRNSVDNHGGFMLRDPRTNFPVLGQRWDLEAEDVIEFCKEYGDS